MKRSTLVFALSSLVIIGVIGCNSAKKDVPASQRRRRSPLQPWLRLLLKPRLQNPFPGKWWKR